jgi:hypothetical protein
LKVRGDNPIQSASQDALGRTAIAKEFAKQILSLDASEGIVVGVLGPWGSGKTSFINLAKADLEQAGVAVIDFNPWMFSGAEQLVDSFFIEVSAQLKIRPGLAEIAKQIQEYGELFSGLASIPFIGGWFSVGMGVAKAFNKILDRRKEGIDKRRKKVADALRLMNEPIAVVIDDVDRLSTNEIRDVFKLVRLTANFPNVVYIVAFDRRRVEEALAEQGVSGRDYLEKILQIGVDMPAVSAGALHQQLFRAIDDALSDIENPGNFDADAWPDIFVEVIAPLIRNMRDVRRYAASMRGTVNSLDGQIALCDVLALEAVRTFIPDVFARLHSLSSLLTMPEDDHTNAQSSQNKVDKLIEDASANADVIKALIRRLFPAAERFVGGSHFGRDWQSKWLKARRVAHIEFLKLYLERDAGTVLLAFNEAENAWRLMSDEAGFEAYMRALDVHRLESVISSLEAYEEDFAAEHVVPGCVVLLNLSPDIPDRPRGMFEFGADMIVGRVVYRLLRSLDDPDRVEAAAREILPKLKRLTGKLQLLSTVGYRENVGHKLISESAAVEMESTWRSQVRAATDAELEMEPDLLRVLYEAKRHEDPASAPIQIPNTTGVTLALLRSAKSETKQQSAGSRSIRRLPRLPWDVLIEIYGSEEILKERIEAIKTIDCGEADLLTLADRYIAGWRPSHRDDD